LYKPNKDIALYVKFLHLREKGNKGAFESTSRCLSTNRSANRLLLSNASVYLCAPM